MKFDEFTAIFLPVVEYYGTELSKNALRLYFEGLEHLSINEFDKAKKIVLNKRTFSTLPKIADFLGALNPSEEELQEKIIKAKHELKYAIKKVRSGNSVVFSDKALMCVVAYELKGWHNLGLMLESELENFLKWDFEKVYKFYLQNTQKAPSYLKGRDEIENSHNGMTNKYTKIYVVGDDNIKTMPLLNFQEKQKTLKSPAEKMLTKSIKRICA